jgi:hypothetical protein
MSDVALQGYVVMMEAHVSGSTLPGEKERFEGQLIAARDALHERNSSVEIDKPMGSLKTTIEEKVEQFEKKQ